MKCIALLGLGAILVWSFAAYATSDDPRAYSHGINGVAGAEGETLIFFSSSGLVPTGEDADGNWSHDIYMGRWRPGSRAFSPTVFIQKPEAQEPVDVAETRDGHIMLTLEDGWDTYGEVEQRYAVYDNSLNPIVRYPHTVSDEGHSGHVAAVDNSFVIVYSEGWVNGGGVDNLGSGNGVHAKIYDNRGRLTRTVPISTHKREWWPLIASSDHTALLVWQAYVKDQSYAELKYTILTPKKGRSIPAHLLRADIQYYTYAASYIPAVKDYVVTGTNRDERGFALLLDENGDKVAEIGCMPAIVRETHITVIGKDIYVPSADNRLLHLKATTSSLTLVDTMQSSLAWSTVGSIGFPDGVDRLHWFSLSKAGLQELDFDLKESHPPSRDDLCH